MKQMYNRKRAGTRRKFLSTIAAMEGRRYNCLSLHHMWVANVGIQRKLIWLDNGVIRGGNHERH